MSLNNTPSSERIHIAFFGKRNAGKSSLVNAVTNQEVSVVSDIKGTTTDPVFKSMELLPAGPVMIIDTPGFDDEGELGKLRIKKTEQILEKTDIAVLVTDTVSGETEDTLRKLFSKRNIPFITAYSKSDLHEVRADNTSNDYNSIYVSARTGENISKLRELIAKLASDNRPEKKILGDIVKPGDSVVLVIPIDAAAPKGRLILPQQMIIRELLESGVSVSAVQPSALKETLENFKKPPALVITDSQAFGKVAEIIPDSIMLTSFSILMANYKGILTQAVQGLKALDTLKENDRILISEGCTHHRQCGDIGSVKLPALIEKYTGIKPIYEFTSGTGFPDDLSSYKIIIHCGGCMLNEREILRRSSLAENDNIPFTNYGTAISYMNGILKRTISIFPELCSYF